MDTLNDTLATVARDLGLDNAPPETRDKILATLGEAITRRLARTILTALPEDAHEEYDRLAQAGDEVAVQGFLREKIPNLDEISTNAITSVIEDFKQRAGITA